MPRRHTSVPLPGELFHSSSDIADMDAFVDKVYLPRIRVRKRSWPIDNRIIRQYLSPVFGKRELATLRRGEVEAWLHALAAGGLAPATCNRILAVFKSICLLAVGYGLLPGGSPCAEVASLEKRVRERCLSLTEARRLMAALQRLPRREALALRLLLLTGARKNEILKARWENVDFDERLLDVPDSGPNGDGRRRAVPLSDEAVDVIRAIPRISDSPWLFPGRRPGRPLADIYGFWDTLRHELGLEDVRIQDLRRSFAAFLVREGQSPSLVQRLLGSGRLRHTPRYTRLPKAGLPEAM